MPNISNAIINDFVSFRLSVHTKSCYLTWLPWANPETPRFVSQQLFFELTSSTSPNIENFACNNSVFTNRKRCLLVRQVPQGLFHTGSSITQLFYYLAPLQNDTDVTSRCMQLIFGDKGAATCLIRECPICDWKRGEGRGEKSIGPWTKYGHTRLSSFCSYTNGGCSINKRVFY